MIRHAKFQYVPNPFRPVAYPARKPRRRIADMEILRSFVIRIYRHEQDHLAGLIESVETGEVTHFRSVDDLHAAIFQAPILGQTLSFHDKENER